MAFNGNLKHHQLFGAKPHSLLWDNTCRSTRMQALCLSLCAPTRRTVSRDSDIQMPTTSENDHLCKSERQSENKHHTDRSGTCFEMTWTSYCQDQLNSSFQVFTAAVILSEDNLNARRNIPTRRHMNVLTRRRT